MIWDCFMLRDELDMLEVRLREFEHWDTTHVVVEAPVTHRGAPKPLYYAEHKERFAPWADRITHVVADGLDVPMDPWPREHAQREAAMSVLAEHAADADVVFIADVDEFPPRHAGSDQGRVAYPWHQIRQPVAYDMRLFMYAVDWEYPQRHVCSVAANWRAVKQRGSLAAVRDGRYGYPRVPGGMHLTWLGGLEGQRAKLGVHCHLEMTAAEHDRIWSGACYQDGEHHSGTCRMIPVEVDETWPQMIYQRQCPGNWFRAR